MPWWVWLVGGLVLLTLELVTPGLLVFLFLGAASMLVGLVAALDTELPLWIELAAFSILSVVLLTVVRGPLLARLKGRPQDPTGVDPLVGETATPKQDLAPGAEGQGELRGTVWKVRNECGEPIAAGTRCRVVRVDGLTLGIAP